MCVKEGIEKRTRLNDEKYSDYHWFDGFKCK